MSHKLNKKHECAEPIKSNYGVGGVPKKPSVWAAPPPWTALIVSAILGPIIAGAVVAYVVSTSTLQAQFMVDSAWSIVDGRADDLRWVRENINPEKSQTRDFQSVDLRGKNLAGLNLEGTSFKGAFFDGANLKDANLRGADLTDASFVGADLDGADLRGADLTGVTSLPLSVRFYGCQDTSALGEKESWVQSLYELAEYAVISKRIIVSPCAQSELAGSDGK